MRYEEKTYKLRGLIYQVRNKLKAGWSEEVYHQALLSLLTENGIPALSKPRQMFRHRGKDVHLFEADLIVWDEIILELKMLPFQTGFSGENYAQIIQYLKFYDKTLGLLVNFAKAKVDIKRVVLDKKESSVCEDYTLIKSYLSDIDRTYLRQIRYCLLNIHEQYGLGYPESVYRKILAIDLTHHQIPCATDLNIPVEWAAGKFISQETPHILVAEQYLVHIRSMLDYPTSYDFTRTRTYLETLGLRFGFVVNFGKTELQIHGVKT